MATIHDVEAEEKVTKVLLDLLNSYPGLDEGEVIFSYINEASGIGMFPSGGTSYLVNERYITGWVYQRCLYPFDVIYRVAPKNEALKIRAKEFLEGLGRWLEQQPVMIGGTEYKLDKYPDIESGVRRIRFITRKSVANLRTAYADGVLDWSISLELDYENNFKR